MTNLSQAVSALDRLVVYRTLLTDPLVDLWRQLAAEDSDTVATYCELCSRLLDLDEVPCVPGCNLWQSYFLELVSAADNVFTRTIHAVTAVEEIPQGLVQAVRHDLACLEMVFSCPLLLDTEGDTLPVPPPLAAVASQSANHLTASPLAAWLAATPGWAHRWPDFVAVAMRCDSSVFRFPVLQFRQGKLHGVAHPDPIRLADLIGYTEQRETVVANTARFAAGLPAHNLLLYGDRGVGKSATVKAAAAEFAPHGLRLVEVDRADLHLLPNLLELLRARPYRFVIFVDDLSFAEGDPAMRHLKVLLEGTVQSVPHNVILYATSNRRHLVAESHTDRKNAVRPDDFVQERLALADRFGRTIIYTAPDQDEYLAIVVGLAAKAGINLPQEELQQRALAWAAWQNGRSARTAKQFITELLGSL